VVALLVVLLLAVAALLLLLLTVPRQREGLRGYATGAAFAVVVLGANGSAPNAVRYSSVAVAAALLLAAVLFGTRGKDRPHYLVPLVLWVCWTVLVSLHARSSSPGTVIVLLLVPLLFLLVVPRLSSADIVPLLRWVGITVVVEALIGLAELTVLSNPVWGYRNLSSNGSPVIRYNPFIPELIRVQGTTGHPIIFSLVMMVALLLLVALGRSLPRWFRSICISAAVLSLLLAGTRSAFVAIAVGLVVYLVFAPTGTSRLRNFLVIVGAAVAIWLGDFGLSRLTAEAVSSDSFEHRLEGWVSFNQLLQRPDAVGVVGSGFNSELEIFADGLLQQDGFFVIDNHFIWTLAISGVVGFMLMTAAIVFAWARADRLGRGLLAVMVVMGSSFDLMTWIASASLFILALALPAGLARAPREDDLPRTPGRQDLVAVPQP
jgi:hypothetical protein